MHLFRFLIEFQNMWLTAFGLSCALIIYLILKIENNQNIHKSRLLIYLINTYVIMWHTNDLLGKSKKDKGIGNSKIEKKNHFIVRNTKIC